MPPPSAIATAAAAPPWPAPDAPDHPASPPPWPDNTTRPNQSGPPSAHRLRLVHAPSQLPSYRPWQTLPSSVPGVWRPPTRRCQRRRSSSSRPSPRPLRFLRRIVILLPSINILSPHPPSKGRSPPSTIGCPPALTPSLALSRPPRIASSLAKKKNLQPSTFPSLFLALSRSRAKNLSPPPRYRRYKSFSRLLYPPPRCNTPSMPSQPARNGCNRDSQVAIRHCSNPPAAALTLSLPPSSQQQATIERRGDPRRRQRKLSEATLMTVPSFVSLPAL